MSTNQLPNVSPAERLDAVIEAATEEHYQRLNELLDCLDLTLGELNELFTAIVALRDAGAVAAFRAGWQARENPAPWVMD